MKRFLLRAIVALAAAQLLSASGLAGDDPVNGTAIAATTAAADAPKAVQAQKVAHPERAPLLGAARAGRRLVAVGDFGTILLSDDDGRNWRQAQSVPTRSTLTALDFVDERHGWAVGHGGVVLTTADGGEHWTPTGSVEAGPTALFSVRFDDQRHGLITGAFGFAGRTDDGGATWRRLQISDEDVHLYQIFRGPQGSIWIAGEMGSVFRSEDGERFERVEVPYGGSLWGGMTAPDGSMLLWGMSGTLLRSVDGGQSWTQTATATDNPITAACDLPDGRLVFVGLGGTILTSNDAGATVRTEIRPSRLAYSAVLVANGAPLLFSLDGIEASQRRSAPETNARAGAAR